ncbi:MAG TPA: tetratricopeptide repeat protein, partial [Candidatus Poseidonia sp.]|nr:tetratricopeptide repeat protein [Poseidonia sp.]
MRWPFKKNTTSNKDEARRHYNSKNYDEAEPFLEAMLSDNANDLWALDVLSRLFMNTARHGEAVVLMQRAIASNPKPEYLRRLIHAGCISGDCSIVMRAASRITWTSTDEELLSRMFETFWHEQSCRAFFLQSNWDMDIPFPIFVQAKEHFESGDVEGGIELLNSLMSREVVNESTLMFA